MSGLEVIRPEVRVFGVGIVVTFAGLLFFGVSFLTQDYFTRLLGSTLAAGGSIAIALALLYGERRYNHKETER